MDALCKCIFIIIETIVNSMKTRHVSKVIDVFQRTCSFLLDTLKKETPGQHPFSFFALSNLLTKTCLLICRTGQLTSSEHAKWTYIIYYYICFPLCAHILYFDAAKFSIKQFSLIYFTVSFVRQWDEYEKVIET